MHATALKLRRPPTRPEILSDIYHSLADLYELPRVSAIVRGLTTSMNWPQAEYRLLFLDQIQPQPAPNAPVCVQIRFPTSANARAETLLELYFALDGNIERLDVLFPGKSGKGFFVRCIACLKTATHTQGKDITAVMWLKVRNICFSAFRVFRICFAL